MWLSPLPWRREGRTQEGAELVQPVHGQEGQTPMDTGWALGREMPAGVRTGLSFWLVWFKAEKTEL